MARIVTPQMGSRLDQELRGAYEEATEAAALYPGITVLVDTANGDDDNDGSTWSLPKATFTDAVATVAAHSDPDRNHRIILASGEYDESVTIPRALSNLTLIGAGGRGSAFVAPSTNNATALTVLADDVTLINLGCDGDGTGDGLKNYGTRLRAYGCKFEGGTNGLHLTLATVAQEAADTHGTGADLLFTDCEFAWNTNGVMLTSTDYGALTQVRFRDCTFHDNTAADFEEASGSGGSANVRYRDLDIGGCHFLRQEDGTEPAAYLLLNDHNANTGVVHGCTFPTALDGGKNLVSTGLVWTGNIHTGGISTGQPS